MNVGTSMVEIADAGPYALGLNVQVRLGRIASDFGNRLAELDLNLLVLASSLFIATQWQPDEGYEGETIAAPITAIHGRARLMIGIRRGDSTLNCTVSLSRVSHCGLAIRTGNRAHGRIRESG
jgi:hypothetical protein